MLINMTQSEKVKRTKTLSSERNETTYLTLGFQTIAIRSVCR